MNEEIINQKLNELLIRYPQLKNCKSDIKLFYKMLVKCYASGNKLIIGGNGGSAADADHIVGELMKGFKEERNLDREIRNSLVKIDFQIGTELADKLQGTLPAITLHGNPALSTAFQNDVEAVLGFAQQLYGYGRKNDVFLAITTSGNSENLIYSAVIAKAIGIKVITLTGINGGKLAQYSDLVITVPEKETYKIQELHMPIYHWICLMLESKFYGDN